MREGDNPATIGRAFFGDERAGAAILLNNGLSASVRGARSLQIGQVLTIPDSISDGNLRAGGSLIGADTAMRAQEAADTKAASSGNRLAAVLGYAAGYPALAREVGVLNELVSSDVLTAQQAQEALLSSPRANMTLRSDFTEHAAAPMGGPVMQAWDGVSRGSPAEEFIKRTNGGLDPVRANSWHYQAALSVQDAAAQETGGLAVRFVIGKGVSLVNAAGEFYGTTRSLTIAARDWQYAAMERSMLSGSGIERPVLAEMSIPSFGELNYMAKNTLDFSTKPNGALFWSTEKNMDRAQFFGNLTGKTTLEQTVGGRYLDNLNLFPIDGDQAITVFNTASARFAAGAEGTVNAFTFGAERFGPHGERAWWGIEQPILRNLDPVYPNPKVTNIREWRFPWEPKQ